MGKPLSDHRDHNNPLSMRGEIFRLKALLMEETRARIEAEDKLYQLMTRNAELESRLEGKGDE